MAGDLVLTGPTRVRARFLGPNVVRVTHAPAGAAGFPADRPWLSHVLLPAAGAAPDEPRLSVSLEAGRVHLRDQAGQLVLAESRPPGLGLARRRRSLELDIPATELRVEAVRVPDAVCLNLSIQPDEAFYGWGQWFNAFQRRRGHHRLKIRDAIALLQGRETYTAIPIFLSSRGYLFWLLNSHESEWTLDPGRGEMRVSAFGPGADYIVVHGPAFRDILQTYTALTGRPPLIPRWAFGLMVTGYPQESQPVVLERAREHRRREVPLEAVILDYHWEERFHNFHWHAGLFPDPDGMLAELRRLGVRLGLIVTPFVNSRNRPLQRRLLNALAANLPPERRHDDWRDPQGYAEGLRGGYFAHPQARWWFGQGGMVDFSHPPAAAWWNSRMRPLYEQGVAFFKNDDGEYLPRSGRSALGLEGREYHNLYGFFYGRALYDGMAVLDDRRPFIYARSTWAGSQRYPALFLGDQQPRFEHLRRAVRAGLNMSLLGFAYWTGDVFGLDGRTTPETHRRCAQWALFNPVARYFWRPPHIDGTRFPWSHGPEVEADFRALVELRYRLLPYYYSLAWEAWQTGLPILRPLVLEFQDDERLAAVDDQAMLGNAMMLAPVVEPGADRRRVLLPSGMWHDFWSGESFNGPADVDCAAPPGRLPLLVRGGTILPLGPVLQHIPDDHTFDRLSLHVWPPFPAQGVLYDDDGRTRAYRRGAWSLTHFKAEGDERRTVIQIGPAQGGFPGQVSERRVELVLQRTPRPARVIVGRQEVEAWRYDAVTGQVHVPLVCPVDTGVTVEVAYWAEPGG